MVIEVCIHVNHVISKLCLKFVLPFKDTSKNYLPHRHKLRLLDLEASLLSLISNSPKVTSPCVLSQAQDGTPIHQYLAVGLFHITIKSHISWIRNNSF